MSGWGGFWIMWGLVCVALGLSDVMKGLNRIAAALSEREGEG